MKRCKKCGVSKAVDDFYRAAGTKDGLRGECKSCSSEDKPRRYLADPQAAITRVKRWQQVNPERVNATQRARRATPEAKRRARAEHLMRKYGMTLEQYDAMLAAQGGGCSSVGARPVRTSRSTSTTIILQARCGAFCASAVTTPSLISRKTGFCCRRRRTTWTASTTRRRSS